MPLFYFKVLLLKLKILFLKTNSTNSTRVSVNTSFLSLPLSLFLRADNPSSCGILGYKPTTTIVHNKLLPGKFVTEQSFFRKSLVSFTYDLNFLAISLRACTKSLNFSSPCSQIKKMSSIHLYHKHGLLSTISRIFSSNSAINKILQGRANFVYIYIYIYIYIQLYLNIGTIWNNIICLKVVALLHFHIPFCY